MGSYVARYIYLEIIQPKFILEDYGIEQNKQAPANVFYRGCTKFLLSYIGVQLKNTLPFPVAYVLANNFVEVSLSGYPKGYLKKEINKINLYYFK